MLLKSIHKASTDENGGTAWMRWQCSKWQNSRYSSLVLTGFLLCFESSADLKAATHTGTGTDAPADGSTADGCRWSLGCCCAPEAARAGWWARRNRLWCRRWGPSWPRPLHRFLPDAQASLRCWYRILFTDCRYTSTQRVIAWVCFADTHTQSTACLYVSVFAATHTYRRIMSKLHSCLNLIISMSQCLNVTMSQLRSCHSQLHNLNVTMSQCHAHVTNTWTGSYQQGYRKI